MSENVRKAHTHTSRHARTHALGIVSENVRKCQKVSENVRKCQKMSENVRKCQKMSESVRKCQKMNKFRKS